MFTYPLQVDELYDGLIFWHQLNELSGSPADRSGSSYSGTISGATQGVTGQEGYAVSTDGVTDSVDWSQASLLSALQGLTTITVAFWCAGNSFETDDAAFSIADAGTNGALAIYPYNNTGGMMGVDNAYVWYNNTEILAATGVPAANGTFNHYCFRQTDATTHEFFINGTSVDTAGDNKSIDGGTDIVSIGSYDSAAEFFSGEVDDARIYNRALSDAEITRLATL